MLFGNKIKALRDEQGVLQRQLAAYLEIDTPMFSKIERGDRRAKRSQVIMLAKYFHVDEKEMLTLWLADKILDALEGEDSLALDAIGVAEKNNQTIKVKTIMERAEEHSNAFKRMAAFNNPEFYKLKSVIKIWAEAYKTISSFYYRGHQ